MSLTSTALILDELLLQAKGGVMKVKALQRQLIHDAGGTSKEGLAESMLRDWQHSRHFSVEEDTIKLKT